MREKSLEPIRVGVGTGTCPQKAQDVIGCADTERVAGRHLPRDPWGEAITPRFLPTGRNGLLRREARVTIVSERVGRTQRQCRRQPVEAATHEGLAIESVAEAAVPRIYVRTERIAGAQLVAGAVDGQSDGRTEGRDE